MKNQTNYIKKMPRPLERLYQFGLEDYEIDYLVNLKRKNDLARHWKRS